MTRQEEIVQEIFDSWESGLEASIESWRTHCLPDFIWWNSGRGAIKGMDACAEKMKGIYDAMPFVFLKVPVRHSVSIGDNVVMQERSDDVYDGEGNLIISIPVVGVIEFEGEKLKEWRDYCDDWMLKRELKEKNLIKRAVMPVSLNAI